MSLYSGPPARDVSVPPRIAALARGRALLPVWVNEAGGLTFQIGEGESRLFAKWAPRGSGLDLPGEAARLRWAVRYTPVPEVLDQGTDEGTDEGTGGATENEAGAAGDWLLTRGLPGDSAVSPRWKARPEAAVRAIGAGLRVFHERLPVDSCPFSWSVTDRLEQARRRGVAVPADLPPAPPVDRLVVCHGDACSPNTLLHEDGSWAGHVDLDALGVADRWADLAIATYATQWNYGPGWEDTLLDAYGIAPDPERIRFYRALWDAT
ncbi:aminoglycoside 3'-phosphotransferase [Streptomyces zingiberis]|uniref:Aminoglycoside 3'-phosphotransferase n=1 Tax=Streptomyces zingiberis TaxID=2053010 RepID=A0ABX1BTI9_9ACTN|nr:aminoglycoside 3'-phosphotransferase [Streptomyces zingiberis]NJP99869.1 aminoglycoside 3'-phosphotransferase [Streptomyces zingiberis]